MDNVLTHYGIAGQEKESNMATVMIPKFLDR